MFEVAGFEIAMGQAPDAAKGRMDAVAEANGDEGLSGAIQRIVSCAAELSVKS